MTAKILDGKFIASQIRGEVRCDVSAFEADHGVVPTLAAVLVEGDPASEVYVRNKRRSCDKVGMQSRLHRLPHSCRQDELLELVERLNADASIHGILVQLPLPRQICVDRVLDTIHPLKDVDAFHPENVGLLMQGRPRFLPCTPHGVQQMLSRYEITVAGRHVVIVGRSDIVGKPLAAMLMQRCSTRGASAANATVTVCHSQTGHLHSLTRQADVLVAAIGKSRFITAEMVQPGSTVIDVGINRTAAGLTGDVDFDAVREVAGHITPVPGGVGQLTVVMLLANTVAAARLQLPPHSQPQLPPLS